MKVFILFVLCFSIPLQIYADVVFLSPEKDSIEKFIENSRPSTITLTMSYRPVEIPISLSKDDFVKSNGLAEVHSYEGGGSFYEDYFSEYLPNGYVLLGESEISGFSSNAFPHKEYQDLARKVGAVVIVISARVTNRFEENEALRRYYSKYYFLGKLR